MTDERSRASRQAVVIINPLSGRGRYENQVVAHAQLASDVFGALGWNATIRTTTAAGDAHQFAREAAAARCDLVAVWGGDGTVNEAASALVHTEVPLAIIPAGSGNGLASDLGIPFVAREALTLAATGATMAIDAGEANGSWFFNIAGVGIDAVIAARFAQRGLRRRGPLGYLQLGTTELMRYRGLRYSISLDGRAIEHEAMLVAVANGRQYGNSVCIAPGARLDDGLLEVVIVDQLSLLGIVWRLPALFRGTLCAGPGIAMHAAREVIIRSSGTIPFHVDGEPRAAVGDLVIATHHRSLRVRAKRR
jgi:YegS/Rv2252/BmrU family lipid kinase